MAGFDFNLNQQLTQNASAPKSTDQPKDLSDFINQLFDQGTKWLKLAGLGSVTKLGTVSVLANLNIEQGGLRLNNPIAPSILQGTQGGALAQIAGSVFNYDFGKIVSPQIEGPPIEVPNSYLGGLSPSFTPSGGMGSDMGIA